MAYADLYFGASRTGKTTQIGVAAARAKRVFGKPSHLVTADLGTLDCIQAQIDDGTIAVWNLKHHTNLIEAIDKACQGYWPEDTNDPESKLMSPFILQYTGKCPKCGEVMTSSKPQAPRPCTKCQANTSFTMKRGPNPANDLSTIAIVAFEGITSFGDGILSHLLATRASLSQDPSYVWKDGETEYAGGNMTYYGFLQQRLPEFIAKSTGLPVADRVIWTALEGKGIDEASKAPVLGALFTGGAGASKLTGKAPAWFRHCLHFETVEKIEPAKDGGTPIVDIEYRMYIKPHADQLTKAVFVCGLRIPKEFSKQFPAWMEPDVGKLYDKIDELQGKRVQLASTIWSKL